MSKKFHYSITVFILCLVTAACKRNDIKLDIVRHIPVYINNNFLYGEDIKSMQEKNNFILATGKIDTTDEQKPIPVALISVNKKMIQLELIKWSEKDSVRNLVYYGNDYTVSLSIDESNISRNLQYTKAHLIVNHQKEKSEYTVFRQGGYD